MTGAAGGLFDWHSLENLILTVFMVEPKGPGYSGTKTLAETV
jgi:hypothetical protein